MTLKIAPCSHKAATTAVMRFHYSQSMPCGKLVKYGVWEDGEFIGAVIYGRGGAPPVYKRLKMKQTEACDLVRVALKEHKAPVTKIVAITLRMLRKSNPGLHMVFSFSDLDQGHEGTIYKAGNWICAGLRLVGAPVGWVLNGKKVHMRTVVAMVKGKPKSMSTKQWLQTNVDPNARIYNNERGKKQWLYPLSEYGKQRAQSIASDALRNQRGEGGANPTCALSHSGDRHG